MIEWRYSLIHSLISQSLCPLGVHKLMEESSKARVKEKNKIIYYFSIPLCPSSFMDSLPSPKENSSQNLPSQGKFLRTLC